jgi:hypothetical protein
LTFNAPSSGGKIFFHKLHYLTLFFETIHKTAVFDQNLLRSWQVTGLECKHKTLNIQFAVVLLIRISRKNGSMDLFLVMV